MNNRIEQILDFAMIHDIILVSFGLASNPNGFCFERGKETTKQACLDFTKMLNELTN